MYNLKFNIFTIIINFKVYNSLHFLILFSTSNLQCETGFSAMLAIKNKYRSKLELEPDVRMKLTNMKPDIANNVLVKTSPDLTLTLSNSNLTLPLS